MQIKNKMLKDRGSPKKSILAFTRSCLNDENLDLETIQRFREHSD